MLGNHASSLGRAFMTLREQVESAVTATYPPDTASIALGILTGSRVGMSEELRDRFVRSGLSHLLVVSGFNVAILALALSWLFSFLPVGFRTAVVCLGICGFVGLVGLDPPVVRAGITGICSYLAIAAGRSFRPLPFVLAIAVAMLAVSPDSLVFDPSFQLSFLAVGGLILLRPFFLRVFRFVPGTLGIRESLVMTFSALVATLPVIALSFGQISLVAPLANLFAAPAVGIATVLAAINVPVAMAVPTLGYPIGFAEDLILRFVLFVSRLGDLPFASVSVDFG
ncbi:MAG TPA: ComEC/Rec2 family competence protein [bacterium]|nr:ComEC/Rec2 family competence protein [bacterium]